MNRATSGKPALDKTVDATIAAPLEAVRHAVGDLGTYPNWMELVAESESVAPADGDVGPAWDVTIRAKIGPFARSKRLRMVRTIDDPGIVRFERRELDEREHSAWVMTSKVNVNADDASATDVSISLSYDGALWSAALEPVLGTFIGSATEELTTFANRAS